MKNKLLKSTSSVAGMTMLSRVLGFLRDIILAQLFGASAGFDAFIIAFKIPNFFRRLFGEGAFSQAFVPVLSEYCETKDQASAQRFVGSIAGTLGLILLLIVLLAELIAPAIVYIFAPGFADHPSQFLLAEHMVHITAPYLFFICIVAFCAAVLNTFKRFIVPAFTPVLLNLSLIVAALFFSKAFHTPIYAIAWGVFFAGILQILLQLPFLKKEKMLVQPRVDFKNPGVRQVMKLMLPALFGVSIQQISLLIDNLFASFLPAGSISWLYYSDRLTYLPLGVIGVALATVVLPTLSRAHAKGSVDEYQKTLAWSLNWVWFLGLPCALGLVVLAKPILVTLFMHGAFNLLDVNMTAKSLMAYAIGLPGFMFIKVLASAFYSRKEIKTPVKLAGVALLLNVILNFVLIKSLAHAGLALSSAIAASVNAFCLWLMLRRRLQSQADTRAMKLTLKMLLAGAVMFFLVFLVTPALPVWLATHEWLRILLLLAMLLLGLLIYFMMLFFMGVRKRDLLA